MCFCALWFSRYEPRENVNIIFLSTKLRKKTEQQQQKQKPTLEIVQFCFWTWHAMLASCQYIWNIQWHDMQLKYYQLETLHFFDLWSFLEKKGFESQLFTLAIFSERRTELNWRYFNLDWIINTAEAVPLKYIFFHFESYLTSMGFRQKMSSKNKYISFQ